MNQSANYIETADFWKKAADRNMGEAATIYAHGFDEAAQIMLRNASYCLRKAAFWRVMGEALAGVAK